MLILYYIEVARMYLERIRKHHGKKQYVTTLIRESYRDGGKVKHRTIANLSKLPSHITQNIETLLNNQETNFQKLDVLKICNSREYGASSTFMNLARELSLDKIIYSRKVDWQQDALAMIIGRLIYQGSKLHLTHIHHDSILWELTGFKNQSCPDVAEHCYRPLDRLLERQTAIQKELADKHLKNGSIILYDITSSYLEGEYAESELVDFGYSRDNKRKHEQIVIGLLTNEAGCPVAVEVFRGNTSDQTTVLDQAKKLANDYHVKDVIFVGDRGMLTPKRIDEVNDLGYKTLTALSHPQLRELRDRGVINPGQFTKDAVVEIADLDNASIRYFLCKNPDKEIENKETRDILVAKTKEALEKVATNNKKNEQQKCAQIGKILAKYKVGKFFEWSFQNNKLSFQIDDDKITAEEDFDGCYVIRTDSTLNKEDAVTSYKNLTHVERAFRNIKTMSLEIRPIYHQLDHRIKAHVFLCMLAYYIEWHAMQRLKPLFAQDGKGAKKHFSFARVIERLKSIRIQDCSLNEIKIPGIITTPDNEQQKILDLLKCSQKREI
jgi:transposase